MRRPPPAAEAGHTNERDGLVRVSEGRFRREAGNEVKKEWQMRARTRTRGSGVAGTLAPLLCVLAVVGWLCGAAKADGAIGRLPFRHYSSDDGLSLMLLLVGAQDGAGFTWAGGMDGLVRYDGLRFRHYGLEDGLPSALITDLAVDPDGVLWGLTSRGAFHESRGKLVAFGVGVLPENATYQIAFDTEKRFWAATGAGPFRMVAPDKLELAPGWPGGAAEAMMFDADGGLLISHGSRLLRRAPGQTEFRDVGHDFAEPLTALVRDGTRRLWLRAGAHLWSQRTADSPFEDRSADYLGAPVGGYSRRLALGADKKLLIPSSLGLITVDDDGGRLVATDISPGDATSIRACWVDREGALWLAGLGLQRQIGRGLWRTMSVSEGLPSNEVWSIVRSSAGLVVGTETGVITIDRGRVERLPGVGFANSLAEGPPGTLWIGGVGKVTRYDLATRTARSLGAESNVPPLMTSVVAADQRGELWSAFDGGGLYRAPRATPGSGPGRDRPKLERVALPGGTPTQMILKILIDDDRIWLGTSDGLYVQAQGAWRRFTKADGLRSNAVALIVRHRGELCVSYEGQSDIDCFVYAGGKLSSGHHRTAPDKLVPRFMGEDANGRLWLGTSQGVVIIDGDRVDQFPRADGAPGDNTIPDTFVADADGTVWIGTSSGLGRFDGARYRGPPPPPRVALVSGQLGGRPLDLTVERQDEAPHESSLEVGFSAMSNINERNIEHQVKLVGYDVDWQRADSREARYQKLPGGSYRFLARARRPDGPWGEATSFGFNVHFPFWQRWWFRALAGAMVLLVLQLTRWRVRALGRQNAELESTVKARNSQLESEHGAARRILDAVEQGLFSVAPDGTIEREISAAARRWFGSPVPRQRVWDWLTSDREANQWLQVGWESYQEGLLPKDLLLEQLPRRLSSGTQTYALRWLPNDTPSGALVIATDITATLEVERAERGQRETVESLRKLHEDRTGYLEFIREAERLVDDFSQLGNERSHDARLIHTLKGNSSIFALGSFAAFCHEIETKMQEDESSPSVDDRSALRARWTESIRHLRPVLDLESTDSISIPRGEFDAALTALGNGALVDLERRLQHWRFEATRPRLERIAEQAGRLAISLDKGAIEVSIEDHGVRLPPKVWTPFWTALIHVIRNAVDHGLESEDERVAAGKTPAGRLTLETRVAGGELIVSIHDDGRGIDWKRIAVVARERGLPHATSEELVDALFSDGVSTVERVTETSGRGLGMSATRDATKVLGGHIVIHSVQGQGTGFEFRFGAEILELGADAAGARKTTRAERS
jgi:ligand-binding sensor domain-containing protein/HPt (histidine-containing phosphotransfer) domain-containing protein